MNKDTKIITIGTFCVIVFGMVTNSLFSQDSLELEAHNAQVLGSYACRADTYACPDGTLVGRVPPYCHFDVCSVLEGGK